MQRYNETTTVTTCISTNAYAIDISVLRYKSNRFFDGRSDQGRALRCGDDCHRHTFSLKKLRARAEGGGDKGFAKRRTDERSKSRAKLAWAMPCKEEEKRSLTPTISSKLSAVSKILKWIFLDTHRPYRPDCYSKALPPKVASTGCTSAMSELAALTVVDLRRDSAELMQASLCSRCSVGSVCTVLVCIGRQGFVLAV
jgi:hypothetical protein